MRSRVWLLWVMLSGCGWAPTPATPTPKEPAAGREPEGRRGGGARRNEALNPPAAANRPVPAGKPNVLLIIWDTVRADHLSVYGYERETTPRLEALAKESVVFERAVSAGMWTVPSHASLFTGLPESAHGATAAHHWLDQRFTTVASQLHGQGWSTWLFAANPYLQDHTGIGRGFETREFPVDEKWKKKAKDATMGKVLPDDASNTLAPKWKPGRYPSGRSADKAKDSGPVATEALLGWLDARPDKERPFFATINYMEAHIPRIPTLASRKALFTDAQIADQLKFDQSYGYLLAYTVGLHEFSAPEIELIGQVYDATLRDLDAATGDLLDQLKARGVLDNTIVIITADHGEHLGDHHRADHKFSVYNALVRVPLIIRYPPALAPKRSTDVVSSLDLFATIADLTGTPLPPGTLSKSMLGDRGDAALSELVEPTRAVFERMERAHPEFNKAPYELTYTSIETPSLKCIQRSDGHRELYDMVADPSELTDLAPARPADAEALCGRIAAWKASVPVYDPKAASAEDGPGAMDAETRKALEALGYTSPDEPATPATPAAPGAPATPRRKRGGAE